VEINYEIHDKEFLAIMDAFEEWRQLFEGPQHEITVYSNHKNLQYFMTIHVLNQRSWVGIVLILILVCHHMSPWVLAKEP
jgi:hypothetical protein